VLRAKRDNVPVPVRGTVFLNVRPNFRLSYTALFRAIRWKLPTTEFLPMVQPTTTTAIIWACALDVFDFHGFSFFLYIFNNFTFERFNPGVNAVFLAKARKPYA
jgi:hypothetical protein